MAIWKLPLLAASLNMLCGAAWADAWAALAAEVCAVFRMKPCPPVAMTGTGTAHTDGARLYIAAALDRWVPHRCGRLFVLGHEIGHIFAGHTPLNPLGTAAREYQADHLATAAAAELGCPCNTGAALLRGLAQRGIAILPADRAARIEALCAAR